MSRVLFGTNYPMRVAEQLVAEERHPSQHPWGVPGLLRAARLWPGPVVAVVHPGVPRGRLWSRALRAYDVVRTLSQAVRERLITELGRDRETTLHAPWGPDLTFGPYAEPSSHEAVVATGKTARDTRTLLAALGEPDAPAIVHSRAALDDAPPQVEVRAHAGVTPYFDALATCDGRPWWPSPSPRRTSSSG